MKVLSPAKINLFLHVTGRRPDGYHRLVSLMCCIELYDTIELVAGGDGIRVSCDHPLVPDDENNLAWRAARLFFDHLDASRLPIGADVRIRIAKKIPVGAGLGGGSSNAATVLVALNRLCGSPCTPGQLARIGLKIGADIPFFIYGLPAIVSGIGEQLSFYGGLPTFSLLIVYPQVSVSTAEIYKNLDLGLTKCEKQLTSFLLNKKAWDPSLHLCNDLETVSVPRYPQISAAKTALHEQGATGALMSGSGSAVFGIFTGEHEARLAMANIEARHAWQLFFSQTCPSTGWQLEP